MAARTSVTWWHPPSITWCGMVTPRSSLTGEIWLRPKRVPGRPLQPRQACSFLAPPPAGHGPVGKIRFQSFFMLTTTHPRWRASSLSAWVKVPTLVSGRPSAGP